jgi:hypothetical protein
MRGRRSREHDRRAHASAPCDRSRQTGTRRLLRRPARRLAAAGTGGLTEQAGKPSFPVRRRPDHSLRTRLAWMVRLDIEGQPAVVERRLGAASLSCTFGWLGALKVSGPSSAPTESPGCYRTPTEILHCADPR